MKKTVCFLAGCLLVLSGCRTANETLASAAPDGEWNVMELNGRRFPSERGVPQLTFDADSRRFSGFAGCNRFAGEFAAGRKGAVGFSKVVSTRKACVNTRVEDELLRALNEAVRLEAGGETTASLTFYGAGRRKLFVLEKASR
ncbi:MAG: META domain-containing protein [Tannerellaceae bacterium]|jgi:heat shock protein HslJ|nr:META domain-containing protein [Tannerellaceae bacterium]